ncbi:MAG TPA: hypothetical protein VM286_00645 [Candidatus Thermoplasmatota archaeon]|nr:hypothetical protein [Candidatus Thermoplasmatota archaeon]
MDGAALPALLLLVVGLGGCIQPAPPGDAEPGTANLQSTPTPDASPSASASPTSSGSSSPPVSGSIHPGTELLVDGGRHHCTAGFLLQTPDGSHSFVATAGHCFYAGAPGDPVTCASRLPSPDGARGSVSARLPQGDLPVGRFVYVSFAAMQERATVDPFGCYYDDFALVELDAAAAAQASPAFPDGTVPTRLRTAGVEAGTRLRAATFVPQRALVGEAVANPAYRSPMVTAALGVACLPGDSGAPVIDSQGDAVGLVLTQPALMPEACGIGLLAPLLAEAEAALGTRLVLAAA